MEERLEEREREIDHRRKRKRERVVYMKMRNDNNMVHVCCDFECIILSWWVRALTSTSMVSTKASSTWPLSNSWRSCCLWSTALLYVSLSSCCLAWTILLLLVTTPNAMDASTPRRVDDIFICVCVCAVFFGVEWFFVVDLLLVYM